MSGAVKSSAAEIADLVLVGGRIATMDAAGTWTDAVAVGRGRILALGEAEVRARTGRTTEVVHLEGRLLLPGFHDAHVHPLYGGLLRSRCDLNEATDAEECLRRVDAYARTRTGPWILGGGWDSALFPGGSPGRTELDAVTGDRPAYLVNQDHHDAWVNSAALRCAGIDRTTPDPPDGRIARDHDGHPSGTLHEGATELVARVLPTPSAREYEQALLEAQRYLHARGVTSWHDALLGRYLGYGDPLPVYRDLDRRGLLTARVCGALWWDRHRGADQLDELRHRREHAVGHRFRADAVKIMQDGVCENGTAAMLVPYLGDAGSGYSYVDADTLQHVVPLLDAEGFRLHFHAVGDRAVREALDAVEQARARNGHSGPRHQIAHVQVVHPEDIARFPALGVAANIQAYWAVNDAQMTELTVPHLGLERSQWQYPFRSLLAAGTVLAAGSDWPVSEAAPLNAVHVAVNRQEPDDTTEPLIPEQALRLDEALAAYTTGSAWVDGTERHTGSLEVGKAADLVVLDRDPFAGPAAEIGHTQVDLTVADGRIVYSRRF